MRKIIYPFMAAAAMFALSACTDDDTAATLHAETDANYVGTAQGNFTADEWYPGGKLGTTDNIYAGCYEDETPAVTEQGLDDHFNEGDLIASARFTLSNEPYKGWGPVASRRSCEDCHSGGYSHGHSRSDFNPEMGNGYIVSVYTPDSPGSNDGPLIDHLTTFTMTMAQTPFLPPLDPAQVNISWENVTAMESGLPLHFPDGEKYSLRYPAVTIPQSAFNTDPAPSGYDVRLIVSCNFQGLGLIDAISNEELEKQYRAEASAGVELNPMMWDAAAGQMAETAYATDYYGKKFIKRFNYDLLEGCLQNDVALWDELNILRSDKHQICSTEPWARAMSKNQDVIKYIKENGANPISPVHPYYNDGTEEGISEALAYLLSPNADVDLYDNPYYNFKPEMTDDQYYSFMVWHRGLAVPRARNLNDPDVQRGKELFMNMGCANCHRPSWTTGEDNYGRSEILAGRELPRYAHQVIYPYTDFIQHRLAMKNDIHGSWCRTTPLWGRGLSMLNSGAQDRLRDARARNEVEAIMWHAYSKQSQAYTAAEKFYNLPKADRDAVVKFLQSI